MLNELVRDELYEVKQMQKEFFIGETEEEQKERFKISDIDGANWVFRKLRAITEKGNEIKELANKEIERIKNWEEAELKDLEYNTEFFEGLLIEYFVRQKEMDPKFKISTPYGKVSSRKSQPKWNYEDETVIQSLKSRGISHLIRTKEIVEVEKAEFKKSVDILNDVVSFEGEIVNGIKFVDGNFINIDTGEIEDLIEYKYHKQAIVYSGQVIEGITVAEQPDSITIKVVD